MKLTKLFREFFDSEKAGGLILIIATALSLILANSQWQGAYTEFWATDWGGHTITQWINDGLMAIFFLLIGLELEREIYEGELSDIRNASLPIVAALGGMLVPAGIFMLLNYGLPTQAGTGIPMATDIAFAIGILSLLGNKVPASLKVFLTALAVIDDLGAIVVIAIFYSASISLSNLMIALGIYAVLILLNRLKVCNMIPYLIGGILMWYLCCIRGCMPPLPVCCLLLPSLLVSLSINRLRIKFSIFCISPLLFSYYRFLQWPTPVSLSKVAGRMDCSKWEVLVLLPDSSLVNPWAFRSFRTLP